MMYILQFAETPDFPEGRLLLDAKLMSYLVKRRMWMVDGSQS